jgi:hypothetical protein
VPATMLDAALSFRNSLRSINLSTLILLVVP